jgi:undecaprenyl-phosphate 4-deoxy-4-formamido-L-arabinose transferase
MDAPIGPAVPELTRGISVVVPCYNSQESLPLLVERLRPVLATLAERFEIILVNDASRDRTWPVIESLAASHHDVVGINLMRNYGQHSALLCGIRTARFDVIVTMDDDLQHPPELLPDVFAKLTDDVDVVYGTPGEQPHGLFRGMASRITKRVLASAMGAETAARVSAWRIFRTRLRAAFDRYGGAFVSIDVLLTWGTQRFTHLVVRHDPRRHGQSNYTLGKLVTHALNMMTGFSTIPLQWASMIGFILTGFGFLIMVFVLGRYVFGGGAPPGFPFLACIIAMFSGAQLLSLGIIGEYLGRAHFRLLDKPSYVIEAVRRAPPEPRSVADPVASHEPRPPSTLTVVS